MQVAHTANEEHDGDAVTNDPIITIEEEEEVVLFWDLNYKNKGIRELAMGMTEDITVDLEVLKYYR